MQDAQVGVRLSFSLSDWGRWPSALHRALEALRTTRREAASAAIPRGDPERFLEAVLIDAHFDDDEATYALVEAVEDARPTALDDFVDHRTLDLLVARGEYRRALRWIVEPWRSFPSQVEFFEYPNPGIPDHGEWRRRSFVDDVRRLLLILVGAGRRDDAAMMAEQALQMVDDPGLTTALDDARRAVTLRPPI